MSGVLSGWTITRYGVFAGRRPTLATYCIVFRVIRRSSSLAQRKWNATSSKAPPPNAAPNDRSHSRAEDTSQIPIIERFRDYFDRVQRRSRRGQQHQKFPSVHLRFSKACEAVGGNQQTPECV
jgi:hypothetical protein